MKLRKIAEKSTYLTKTLYHPHVARTMKRVFVPVNWYWNHKNAMHFLISYSTTISSIDNTISNHLSSKFLYDFGICFDRHICDLKFKSISLPYHLILGWLFNKKHLVHPESRPLISLYNDIKTYVIRDFFVRDEFLTVYVRCILGPMCFVNRSPVTERCDLIGWDGIAVWNALENWINFVFTMVLLKKSL